MAGNNVIQQFVVNYGEDTAQSWSKWLRRFNRMLEINNINVDEQKKSYLFYYGGDEIEDIYDQNKDVSDSYDDVIKKITIHFNGTSNKQLNILKFRELYQFEGEPFDEFVSRLREKAKLCSFTDPNEEIKSQIIQKCISQDVKRKALESDRLDLAKLINIGKTDESITRQLLDLSKNDQFRKNATSNNNQYEHQINKNTYQDNKKMCFNCGGDYPHKQQCPAKGRECDNCGKLNHYARCCRSEPKEKQQLAAPYKNKKKGMAKVYYEQESSAQNNECSIQ